MGCALGIDAGTVRVGLAASDPTGTIAGPVATLPRRDVEAMWRRIAAEVAARDADRLVVGLPRRLDGSEGEAADDARALADEARRRMGIDVVLWDERFTTAAAERSLIASGMRRRRRRDVIDAVAASLMLQSWLDARRHRR